MNFSKLMVAGATLFAMLGATAAADAKDHRRGHDHRYERDHRQYRSDRDRRDWDRRNWDRRRDWRGADRRRDWRGADGRRYNGGYGDVARRNYEYERDLQTCYRNGRRICP